MIYFARDPVVLPAVFTLALQTAADAQEVLWEMDAKRFEHRQLGQIRPLSEPRFQPLSKPQGTRRHEAAPLTQRPAVIDLGALRDQRDTLEQSRRPSR